MSYDQKLLDAQNAAKRLEEQFLTVTELYSDGMLSALQNIASASIALGNASIIRTLPDGTIMALFTAGINAMTKQRIAKYMKQQAEKN